MPYLISDETRAWLEQNLGRATNTPPGDVPLGARGSVQRAIEVQSGNLFIGYHYGELKWRDEVNFTWNSFDPVVNAWALSLNEEDLVQGDLYSGFFVNVEAWSGYNLAVFAVVAGGGGGGGGPVSSIFARIASANCAAGSFTIVEIEPIAGGGWQDRSGGVSGATAYHFNKGIGQFGAGGPLVQVGTRVRAWRGAGTDWRFDCPAGWTGTKQYLHDVVCCTSGPFQGQLRKLVYFEEMWNGQTIRQPCHQPAPLCGTCPPPPDPCQSA
jgi:hypothetical protein